MSSRCHNGLLVVMLLALIIAPAARARPDQPKRLLRIAADPNNLPFTDDQRRGFENKIAELIARDLHADIQYTWRAQRRCFFREMFKEGDCDLAMGVPNDFDRALTTQPYYRSAYSFVVRKDRADLADLRSIDDPRLRALKIGVQLIGVEGANTPPAHALQRRNLIDNLVGYPVYGDYAQDMPPARIVQAVAAREIDVAIVWGPLAGYFAKQEQSDPLIVTPLAEQFDPPALPLAFDISIGVRKSNPALRDEIDAVLVNRRAEIEQILRDFGVPIVVRTSHNPDGKSASTDARR
jgi:mxaJ protein